MKHRPTITDHATEAARLLDVAANNEGGKADRAVARAHVHALLDLAQVLADGAADLPHDEARIIETHYGREPGAPSVCGPVPPHDQITDEPPLVTCRECALALVQQMGDTIDHLSRAVERANNERDDVFEAFTDAQQNRAALVAEVGRLQGKVQNLTDENGRLRRTSAAEQLEHAAALDALQQHIDQTLDTLVGDVHGVVAPARIPDGDPANSVTVKADVDENAENRLVRFWWLHNDGTRTALVPVATR